MVGGGAGGVELALATQYRLQRLLSERGDDPERLDDVLLTQGPEILPGHNAGVRRRFLRVLGERGVMTKASNADAVVQLEAVPLLDGAAETVAAGILSSLQPQNLRLRRGVANLDQASRHPQFPLLFDPQTAGGLLAGVPSEQADACIEALRQSGYPQATVIGRVEARGDTPEPVRLIV